MTNPAPGSGAAAGYQDPVASSQDQTSSAEEVFTSTANATESRPRSADARSRPSGANARWVTSASPVSTRAISPAAGSSITSSPAAT